LAIIILSRLSLRMASGSREVNPIAIGPCFKLDGFTSASPEAQQDFAGSPEQHKHWRCCFLFGNRSQKKNVLTANGNSQNIEGGRRRKVEGSLYLKTGKQ